MKIFIKTVSFSFLLTMLFGCTTSPKYAATTLLSPECRTSCENFRNSLADAPINGIIIEQKTLSRFREAKISTESIAQTLSVSGFNQAVIEIKSIDNFASGSPEETQLMSLIKNCQNLGIKSAFFLRESDVYLPTATGYWFSNPTRDFFGDFSRSVDAFNQRLPAGVIEELIVRLDAQTFTGIGFYRPKGLFYVWSEKKYGIGGENDRLLQLSLNSIQQSKVAAPQLKLTLIIPESLHHRSASLQKLSGADTNSLLTSFDRILVIPGGATAAEQRANATKILSDTVKSSSCGILLPVVGNPELPSPRTLPEITELSHAFARHGAYSGLLIAFYNNFITQWENK